LIKEKENLKIIQSETENIVKKLKNDIESKEKLLNDTKLENNDLKLKVNEINAIMNSNKTL